jgi:ankyrin repeat protein
MYAARKGHAAVVELLLDKGANPAKRVQGRTAYDVGLSRVLGALLLDKGIGVLPKGSAPRVLVRACADGRIDVVRQLLADGIDVNLGFPGRYDPVYTPATPLQLGPVLTAGKPLPYGPGFTPLMAACAEGHIAVAKVLLANGADVDQRDARGDTALIHAAVSGAVPALKLLLVDGVDVDQRNANGRTALMQATARGEMASVIFLLANGADVNVRSKYGFTALNMRCEGPIHDLLRAHGGKKGK